MRRSTPPLDDVIGLVSDAPRCPLDALQAPTLGAACADLFDQATRYREALRAALGRIAEQHAENLRLRERNRALTDELRAQRRQPASEVAA